MNYFIELKKKLSEIWVDGKEQAEKSDFWVRVKQPPLQWVFSEMERLNEMGINRMIIPITKTHFGTIQNPMMTKSEAEKIPLTPFGLGVFEKEIDCSFEISWEVQTKYETFN